MSELAQYYKEYCCTNAWVSPEASECLCYGRGWWLSDVDTWHRCYYHGKDVPHPEEDDGFLDMHEKDMPEIPSEEAEGSFYKPELISGSDDDIPF